jgi:hypothetical protein
MDMRHCSGVVWTRLATWSKTSLRFRIRRDSWSRLHRSARFLLRSRWAFLASVLSSAGALADSSSAEMSSRYQSGRAYEVPASSVAMNTSRSGVRSPKLVLTTSVGEYSSAFGSTVSPPGRGVSRGRRHSVSCRRSGLRACGRASRRICLWE